MTVFTMPRGVFSMTPEQRDCLQVIAEWVEERGRPPSYRELARELELASVSSAVRLVCCLEERGWVRRRPKIEVLHGPPMPDLAELEWSLAPGPARAAARRRAEGEEESYA